MIETRLEETRRRLLDLTRRNRLLNFGGRGHAKLTIVDERPEQVFQVLVTEGRTLQFLSREEAPAGTEMPSEDATTASAGTNTTLAVIPPLPAAPIVAEAGPPERHRDLFLQTTLAGPELQTRLVRLEREARSAMEEQGCNILFLTLGMVKWRAQEGETTASHAPLLFVPVELMRRNVHSRHEVRMLDEEILVNPCLRELAARMFGANLPELEVGETFDLSTWLAQARSAVEEVPGWKLVDDVHLGLFSFIKLAMYQDLDPASWPADHRLTEHPLIRLLTVGQGDESLPFAGVPRPETLDDTVVPASTFQVVDADSSQQAAILAACQGSSLVIEGPPGTGKSQTITNLIAEFLAAGKTVLFVAEKAAALQVVEQRLERAGLGSFVLEMHSRKASKRAVLEELSRTLAEEDMRGKGQDQDGGELLRLRQQLNGYLQALHSPVSALATSPFQGMRLAIALRNEREVDCELTDPLTATRDELRQATEGLDMLDRRLTRVGDPVTHPWRGARLNRVAVDTEQKVLASAAAFAESIATARRHAAALTATLGAPAAATPADLERLRQGAQAVLAAPVADPRDPRWSPPAPALVEWLKEGQVRAQKVAEWGRFFQTSAEVVDWAALIARREARKDSMFRFLSGEWRDDSRTIQGQLLPGTRLTVDEQLRLLAVLGESLKLRKRLEIGATHFGPMFGAAWREMASDFTELARRLEAVGAVRRRALQGEMQMEAVAAQLALEDRAALRQQLVQLEQCLPGMESAAKAWLAMIASGEQDWFACPWPQRPLADEEQRLRGLPAVIEKLSDWADCNASADQARATRAAPLVELAFVQAGAAIRGHLARAFERQFWRLWADRVIAGSDALRAFRGEDQEARVGRFRQADMRWLEHSRTRLTELVRGRRPDLTGDAHRESKLGVLKAEMRKKRRHMPLRKLLSIAGDVIQAIKPCFMMSPLSVASLLKPGDQRFDVVIFDEASQVEPADAYGAIARARQAVFLGDEKQLPPTSFFQVIEQEDAASPSSDEVSPADLESILSLAITRFPRKSQCSLRWHYRSRHQSLIEFSNRAFYDHALRLFPSPHHSREELGLVFRHVPEGVYLRGQGQFNPVEARTVAEAVLEHAATSPGVSLGVGAFSGAQQRAIEDEIERMRRERKDDQADEFFDPGRDERFFVKNLETIQGDERDVIFLSVGYGRDKAGKLTMNFGPLNQDGGWRRLNVLVTRSRRRCVLFSSIKSEDLNLGESPPRGVVALKDYLFTAEHGRPPESQVARGDHDSQFEASVAQALRDKGLEVHAQVGGAGFSIDLAIVDPARPGRYLLGIECDGATYHSSPTARDRDRLREQILRGLGWEIVRVWSTDWFRQPDRVLAKILATIAEIQRRPVTPPKAAPAPRPAAAAAPVKPPATPPAAPPPAPARARAARGKPEAPEPTAVIPPYQRTPERSLGSVDHLIASPPEKLAVQIEEIVRIEGPIHEEEVLRVLVGQYGARATARPKVAFAAGLLAAKAAGKVLDKGEFLWPPGMATPPVRERSSEDAPTRPELIAPEEFEAAVLLVVAKEFGLKRDALAARTIKFLGFARGGQKLSAAADAAIGRLLERKALTEDTQGFLVEA